MRLSQNFKKKKRQVGMRHCIVYIVYMRHSLFMQGWVLVSEVGVANLETAFPQLPNIWAAEHSISAFCLGQPHPLGSNLSY